MTGSARGDRPPAVFGKTSGYRAFKSAVTILPDGTNLLPGSSVIIERSLPWMDRSVLFPAFASARNGEAIPLADLNPGGTPVLKSRGPQSPLLTELLKKSGPRPAPLIRIRIARFMKPPGQAMSPCALSRDLRG